ncbi:MAG: hypothetical protein ACRBFS_04650 [Aureispira sp.]
MYFLVQSNIYSDPDHDRFFDALESLQLPYEKIHLERDAQAITLSTNRQDVFVYGSVRLARLAKKNTHWTPGSFYGEKCLFKNFAPIIKNTYSIMV